MIQVKQKLEVMAKQLNLIRHNELPEENILTGAEEKEVFEHTIKLAKENFTNRRLALGERLFDIEVKISEIDWIDEANVAHAIKTANSNKHYEIWLAEKRKQEKIDEEKKQQELISRHTAKFFFNVMAWTAKNRFGKNLIVHEHNTPLVKAICFFLSNDERFVSELGFDFNKGLLIRGVSGLGKTFLFECVKDNELLPITIYSMIELTETVKEEGFLDLPPTAGITYLDDVGTEEHTVNHYGTKITFFKNFIEKYYLNNTCFNKLIISTNNSFSELENKYGFRVRSRIKDMFNIINVTGTDMRG